MTTLALWEVFKTVVLKTSLQAAVLVGLVLAAQWALGRRLSPPWRATLWWLVLARLLLPVSPQMPISLFNWLRWPKQVGALAPATPLPSPPAAMPAARAEPARASELPRPELPTAAGPAELGPVPQPVLAEAAHGLTTTSADAARGAAPRHRLLPWREAILAVWALGGLALGAHLIRSVLRLRRALRSVQPVTDPAALDLLAGCCGLMGVRRQPVLLETAAVSSPALCGLWRPRLLVPAGLLSQFMPPELRFVFLHELAHLRRRDLWGNWLVALVQLAHWFNPLLWLAFSRMRADSELACDALALSVIKPGEERAYGQTILKLLEGFARPAAMLGVVSILEDARQMQRRIRMIARFRQAKTWAWLSGLVAAVLGVVGLTDAQTRNPGHSKTAAAVQTTAPALQAGGEVHIGADPQPAVEGTDASVRTVAVTVLDAATDQPVPGAEIWAPCGDPLKGIPRRLTGQRGQYRLRFVVPPAPHRARVTEFHVRVWHSNYAPRAVAWASPTGDVYAVLPKEVAVKLERGVPIGGLVQDERGVPLAGVRVLLSGSNYRGYLRSSDLAASAEYASVQLTNPTQPAAVTGTDGRWVFPHFPEELETLTLTLIRPDDSRRVFQAWQDAWPSWRPAVELGALRAQTAVFTLRDGLTVRGVVVDDQGRPIAGAQVKEGYGHSPIQLVSEFTAGHDGRFERVNREPRQWIYTATAEGRATASVIAEVKPGMPEVRLVLPPAQPLRLRVVDEQGRPVPEATITLAHHRNEGQILDWSARTDAQGEAVWTNAPRGPVLFYVTSPKLGLTRQFKAAAGPKPSVCALSPLIGQLARVRIKATDAKTHAPVRMRVVAALCGRDFDFKPVAEPDSCETQVEIRAADFRGSEVRQYKLKVEAEGYEPFLTEGLDLEEGDQSIEATLVPGSTVDTVVLRPNGEPAAGARVWVQAWDDWFAGSVRAFGPAHYRAGRWLELASDAKGRLQVPPLPGNRTVIITHQDGFLETTLTELQRRGTARLQAWGRIEGRLLIAGEPRGDVSVSLESPRLAPFYLVFSTVSAADGSFEFTNVPPGPYLLYRVQSSLMGYSMRSHQMPITVRAGETLRVEYAVQGRAVVGRAVPDPADAPVDWQDQPHALVLKQPPLPDIHQEDFATAEAFSQARAAANRSPERARYVLAARQYALVFQPDGRFRIDDVPPGEYSLHLSVIKPPRADQRWRFVGPPELTGSLLTNISVPPGDEPLNLGRLVVPIRAHLAPKSAPMGLKARAFDGGELSLSDLRGQYVLLVFWASWSDRCQEQLPDLNKLAAELGSESRIVFVSANLDDDLAVARQASAALHGHWRRVWLQGPERAAGTAAFEVETLPALFLLDRQGRIAARRDLEGPWVRLVIERALQRRQDIN